MCHQYGIPVLISRVSFCGETSGGVAKGRLFPWLLMIAALFRVLTGSLL